MFVTKEVLLLQRFQDLISKSNLENVPFESFFKHPKTFLMTLPQVTACSDQLAPGAIQKPKDGIENEKKKKKKQESGISMSRSVRFSVLM